MMHKWCIIIIIINNLIYKAP